MRRYFAAFLACLVALSPLAAKEELEELAENTDNLYRVGVGAEDGAFTELGSSMLAWGIGLGVGIALLAGLIHQSDSDTK